MQPKTFINKVKKLIPLNRLARHNEYHGAIKFLCTKVKPKFNRTTQNKDIIDSIAKKLFFLLKAKLKKKVVAPSKNSQNLKNEL